MSLKQRIIPVNIEDQMKSAYIDYSMSVIVSRALPDVRDGLKPVHRRVLYGMSDLGLTYNKSYKKSARIVGEVLGKYHPHGDSSVYDTMVRMAQHWSLRYPLVDGQGNFGSMDGDSPAAMRYTEARLERISDEMLADIGKETVDFAFNFDDTLKEPTVLPARIPNLLVNGASGIAVGMATNMLPHNLTEVVNGIVAQIANPDITIEELMQYIKAPDFPTGGIIYGTSGVREAFETGRGRVVVRGRAEIQVGDNGRETIVVTEIPYQVNKANLVAKIAELVNDKKIIGISDIRDESDRDGLRIVVDVKRDAMASVVLSMLYKYTALQTSYGVNNVALVNGRPELLNLKDIISEFIKFRIEVIVRRTQYDLRKAIARAHILVGLLIALDYIDMVIDLIRGSATPEDARNGLMEGAFIEDRDKFWKQFGPLIEQADTDEYPREEGNALSEAQARAILDMRLQKLTGLERDKVKQEYDELQERIAYLKSILESEELQREIAAEELQEVKEKYGDERRTDITAADGEISIEDLIANEEVVVTISNLGYIKRTPVSEYRKQSRGGRGSRGSKTRDADFVEHLFIASTHNYLLLFTESGRCHWLRVYEIPEASKTSSGRVIQNILAIPKEDRIKAYINIQDLTDEEFISNNNIVFCTRNGLIKKTLVEAYSRPRAGGINAITINEGDQLIEAKLTNGNQEVFIASRSGRAIRFEESKVRAMGRTAAGVRGISLNEDGKDIAVGMVIIDPEEAETAIMVLSEKGMGKRTLYSDYRLTNRGGKGVKNMQITDKTGGVFSIKAVSEDSDLMITTRDGIVIRMAVSDIRVMGRATQGVRLIKLDKHDEMADIAVIHKSEDEDEPTMLPASDEEE
ncbi:DNA gyrase subunit A [Phaeodactylibacter sp.]|uniref:DNA gyrase subunit A n=1 Tax=Phaeodactylibacter sp. TaxID=1940289 RepID=UPI0025F439D4|nr:DNA gyrase subunit A [Phaeodactylibacter sp.]MCI4649342.1 DNA gyrase subunit A [Phaeodactylibacter sp.]MCI5091393.1 DNA gyrase subunit A [Phaeodactylibacter sp.]